jgi:hypothetical protein
MSSSSLQVFSAGYLGIQAIPVLTSTATLAAAQTTAALAAVGPAGAAASAQAPILAAGAVVPPHSYLAHKDPPSITALKKAHQDACFGPGASGPQCSYWSQALASAQASRHCFGGDIHAGIQAAKKSSAVELVRPTWTSPVVASTQPVSSVAITMSSTPAPQIMS